MKRHNRDYLNRTISSRRNCKKFPASNLVVLYILWETNPFWMAVSAKQGSENESDALTKNAEVYYQ